MKTIFFLFLAFIFCTSGYCQAPDSTGEKQKRIKRYHVNYFVTGPIIVAGLVSNYFAIDRLKKKDKITSEEYYIITSDEQKALINSIDRWALRQDASGRDLWKKISNYGQDVIFLLPALLMIDKNIRKDWLDLLLIYVEGHCITFTFYNYSPLGPTYIDRFRPYVYYNTEVLTPDYIMNSNNTRKSFFSGHVGSCTYATFFMTKVYCDYHPELGAKRYLLYLAASVPALGLGYARIRSLDHFPSDVVVGFGLGALVGIVLPQLHKNKKFKDYSLGMFSSPYGTGLTVGWNLSN